MSLNINNQSSNHFCVLEANRRPIDNHTVNSQTNLASLVFNKTSICAGKIVMDEMLVLQRQTDT